MTNISKVLFNRINNQFTHLLFEDSDNTNIA
jgi:hypothetical protein